MRLCKHLHSYSPEKKWDQCIYSIKSYSCTFEVSTENRSTIQRSWVYSNKSSGYTTPLLRMMHAYMGKRVHTCTCSNAGKVKRNVKDVTYSHMHGPPFRAGPAHFCSDARWDQPANICPQKHPRTHKNLVRKQRNRGKFLKARRHACVLHAPTDTDFLSLHVLDRQISYAHMHMPEEDARFECQ